MRKLLDLDTGSEVMKESEAERELRNAGWFHGRNVEIGSELDAYQRAGYETFPALSSFLREYGGICLLISHAGRPDEIWFSASRACSLIDTQWVREYSIRAGVAVVPIGAAYRDHLAIMLGENERIFGGYDNEFGLVGVDIQSAVSNLLENRGFVTPLL